MSDNAHSGVKEVDLALTELKINEVNGEPVALANSEDLLRLLECPICTLIQVAPIYNCESGHSICYRCRRQTKRCPTCRRPFTSARNYLAESIAETAKITCAYTDKGCTVVSTVLDHSAHVANCDFRPVICYVTKTAVCKGVSVELSSLFAHLIGKHSIAGHELEYDMLCDKVERTSVLNNGARWPPFYLKVENSIFLKETVFVNGILYWWIVLVSARPKDANEYCSTIVILLSKSDDMTFKYSVPVHHFRKSPDQIISSGKCASLPYNSVIPFSRSEEHGGIMYAHCWDMQFSVSKKEKEAKRQELFKMY